MGPISFVELDTYTFVTIASCGRVLSCLMLTKSVIVMNKLCEDKHR